MVSLCGVTNATPLSAYDTPPFEGILWTDIVTKLTASLPVSSIKGTV